MNPPNKEQLVELFLGKNQTVVEIANHFGVAKSTAQRWLKQCGISKPANLAAIARGLHHEMNRPQMEAGTYSTRRPTADRLREIYCGLNIRRKDIAAQLNVPVWVVKEWLREFGIVKPQSLACINSQHTRSTSDDNVNARIGARVATVWAERHDEIMAKRTATSLEKYGVANPAASAMTQAKRRKTNELRYGVPNPMFNAETMSKNKAGRFQKKGFVFPSGKTSLIMGYEGFCLRDLLKEYCEEDLICADQGLPIIPYVVDGAIHHHLPDTYVKPTNLLIDVKSEFTLQQHAGYPEKAEAASRFGFKYAVWVYDRTGKFMYKIE